MPCLLSATFIAKNRARLCPSDEPVRAGTSSALAMHDRSTVQKLQLGYWNLSLLDPHMHKDTYLPEQLDAPEQPHSPSQMLSLQNRSLFCLLQPPSFSLALCGVAAMYRADSGCVIAVLLPCFSLLLLWWSWGWARCLWRAGERAELWAGNRAVVLCSQAKQTCQLCGSAHDGCTGDHEGRGFFLPAFVQSFP